MAGGRYHMDMRWRHATGDHQELFRKNARVAIATLRELGVMT